MWWRRHNTHSDRQGRGRGQGSGEGRGRGNGRGHGKGRCHCRRNGNRGHTLKSCRCLEPVTIRRIDACIPCASRLRELGIIEGGAVMVLKHSDPLLILAQDSRIAIDLRTAAGIEIDPGADD